MITNFRFSLLVSCLFFWLIFGQIPAGSAGENESIRLNWQFSFGKSGSGPGEFNQPQAMSLDPSGGILICDTENHRIQKFDATGQFQQEIGGFGWQADQFYQPMDVQARSALDIFVADYQNQRVVRYDRQLNYISAMQVNATWDERFQFTLPRAIAFSSQREMFVLDDENFRIIKFNNRGEPELRFGDTGVQLKQPCQIEIDRNERVFVSDEKANAVLVFDYFGNYLTRWGEGILNQPTGLFWDARMLLVADSGNRRIVIFDANGMPINLTGINENRLKLPMDMVLFKTKIYILDAEQGCVHVFEWVKQGE